MGSPASGCAAGTSGRLVDTVQQSLVRARVVIPPAAVVWVLLAVISAAPVSAQTATTTATTAILSTELPTDAMPPGRRFNVDLTVPVDRAAVRSVHQPAWPRGVRINEGPVLIGTVIGTAEGSVAGVVVRFVATAAEPGAWVIPPIEVEIAATGAEPAAGEPASGDQTPRVDRYRSEPAVVLITSPTDVSLVPPKAQWVFDTHNLVEGRVVAVALMLVDALEVAFPAAVAFSPPSAGVFEEVQGLGQIRSQLFAGRRLHRIPVATFLFTLPPAGELRLPQATIGFDTYDLVAPAVDVVVAPVGPAFQETGAIGSFVATVQSSHAEVTQGETVRVTLRITGEGNLNFFQPLPPGAPGLVLVDSDDTLRAVGSDNGYRGFRELVYRFIARDAGSFAIETPPFRYFDPATGRVHGAVLAALPITITGSVEQAAAAGGPFRMPQLLPVDVVMRSAPWHLHRRLWAYLLIGLGPLMVLARRIVLAALPAALVIPIAFVVLSAAAPPDAESTAAVRRQIETAAEQFAAGQGAAAAETMAVAAAQAPGLPGVRFNQAVIAFDLEQPGAVVFFLREAIRLDPAQRSYRDALAGVETVYNLQHQAGLPPQLDTDHFFILAICAVFGAGIVVLRRRRFRGSVIIPFVLLCAVAVVSWSLVAAVVIERSRPVAVGVVDAAPLRAIPAADAQVTGTLSVGSAVMVTGEASGFLLVRTAYAVESWLARDHARVTGGDL